MTNPPPSDRTHPAGVHHMMNPHFQCGMPPPSPQLYETNPICPHNRPAHDPKMRNEPNFIPPAPRIMRNEPNLPYYHHPNNQNTQNEPNLHPAHDQKCETNPIKTTPATGGPPLYLTPTEVGNPPNSQNIRNEPNLPSPRPKYAKRTQSGYPQCPAAPCFSETNPIPTYQVPRRPLFQQNEPNFHTDGRNTKD